MTIIDRNLEPGTRLVAKHKKNRYFAVIDAEGRAILQADSEGPLPIESTYKSLSAAGQAITGNSVNGWRFWSVDDLTPEDRKALMAAEAGHTAAEEREKKKANGKMLFRTPNQKGATEGMERWFCNGCMVGFEVETGTKPEACPAGHSEGADG